MKLSYLFFSLFVIALVGCGGTNEKDHLFVVVQYKTQQNKNVDAIVALKSLIKEVEKEDHFVEIELFVDPNDNSNIMLLEEWDDEMYYKNEHMKTEHLQKFITESAAFLTGPPEITYWNLNSSYD